MARRTILSTVEHESLLTLPDDQEELFRRYAFSESDLAIIRQRRRPANRLGFAVQLCYLGSTQKTENIVRQQTKEVMN